MPAASAISATAHQRRSENSGSSFPPADEGNQRGHGQGRGRADEQGRNVPVQVEPRSKAEQQRQRDRQHAQPEFEAHRDAEEALRREAAGLTMSVGF